ncbi:hypothetical protein CDAR_506081 [Caerostris darwini]|uniref:Uncharacterized protein n=1 Tax=Caerostris darwini TaxID=1538125 RepID=A0AAV4WH00_9ARAC|nr:hypothetical protein CDAR_506081 [Caerostris darwini]
MARTSLLRDNSLRNRGHPTNRKGSLPNTSCTVHGRRGGKRGPGDVLRPVRPLPGVRAQGQEDHPPACRVHEQSRVGIQQTGTLCQLLAYTSDGECTKMMEKNICKWMNKKLFECVSLLSNPGWKPLVVDDC